jgi:putative ABC transport system permease protein
LVPKSVPKISTASDGEQRSATNVGVKKACEYWGSAVVYERPRALAKCGAAEVSSAKEEGARTLSILLASVALVSLATGGIGILNIMLVSVTERTREIGIRLAIGAKRKEILWQFLLEAIGLSIFGGVAGVVVGFVAALIISQMADWSLIVEPWSVVLAVASSVLVGVFFGSYPALRASMLDPVEAIRSV